MPTKNRVFTPGATAIVLASLFASSLRSQEPLPQHVPSENCSSAANVLMCTTCRELAGLSPLLTPGNVDWRIQKELQKVAQLVNFLADNRDEDNDREKARDHKKKDRAKKNDNSRKSKARIPSADMAKHPPRHMEPTFAPMHPQVLELLTNMNRTLKSIESMMREDLERDRKQSNQSFQQPNRMPRSFGPQVQRPNMQRPNMQRPNMQRPNMQGPNMQGPNLQGPNMQGPNMQGPNMQGPMGQGSQFQPQGNRREFDSAPRNEGPRNEGPRNDGPRNDGPRKDGPRNDGPRNDGPRNDGPRNDPARNRGEKLNSPKSALYSALSRG